MSGATRLVTPPPDPGAEPPGPAAGREQRPSGTQRFLWWFQRGLAVVGVVLGLLFAIDDGLESRSLPSCDSHRARSSLTGILRERHLDATGTQDRRTVSSSETEVVCAVRVTVRDAAPVQVDYRFFREGEAQRMGYTIRTVPTGR
ncbi:hypothetical protein [Muricoccus radiodurans]|uniref:hypothetical protein n=1 Tax=Muricoccus radiodurans TaxID=2231721 RepID=UPI003CF204CE